MISSLKNPSVNTKILPFAFFGNALEFYEFTVYAVFAPLFAKEFFVTESETLSLIYSWSAFAVAFFTRPIGAFVFGYIGDKFGRKIALSFSILSMACATLAIGLLPNYNTAGLFAPIAMIGLRMVQGISTGGEYNGAAIYLIEKFQYKLPGFIGGISMASCVIGAFIGTVVGKWCSIEPEYWRLAFMMGGAFGMVLFFLRFMLTESLVLDIKTNNIAEEPKLPLRLYVSKFLANVAVAGFNGSFSYTLFGFSIMYLQKYVGYTKPEAFNLNIAGMAMFCLSNPFWGYMHDKLTSKRYWNLIILLNIITIMLVLKMITSPIYMLNLMGIIILGAQTGSIAGPSHAFFQEGIHARIRYRFVSISCSIGMAVIGGVTPMVLTYVIEKYNSILAPCFWIGGLGVIAWILCSIMYAMWDKEKKNFPS